MSTPEQTRELVRHALAGQTGEFRPCAYYDESLDCIRLITRDCSVTETRVNGFFTLLEATYPQRVAGHRKVIGFTIKGAKYFCHIHHLSLKTPIRVSTLLDALIRTCPDAVVESVVKEWARPLISEVENVEPLGAAELQPA